MHFVYSATFRAKTSAHLQAVRKSDQLKKKQKKLINTNVITRHNAIVISCDEQMRISSFSLFKHFPIKVNDVTIKSN